MILKRFFNLKKLLTTQPLFYSFMPQKTEPLKLIKKYHDKNLLLNYSFMPKYMILVISIIVWPFWSINLSIKHLKKNGKKVQDKFGKSLFKQFIELLYYSNVHLIKPNLYYYFGLFEKENKRNATYYLTDWTTKRIFNSLGKFVSGNG